MQNPSRSVCIIENAIDRLIDYGDRIHAAYGRQNELERIRQSRSSYRTTASRSLDISVCGKKGGTGQASSSGYSITSGTRRSCKCSRSCKCATRASKVSSEERRFASPLTTASRSSYRTTASRSLDISVCGKKGGTGQASSSGYSITSGTRRSCKCSRSCKCATRASKVSSEERRFASPLTTASIVSEKETVNQFFYTVTKGNRRCTIPGKMYSKRLPDSWVHINFVLFDEDGSELLNLNTDIMQEALRNTFVNGKPVTFVQ
ncbi:hypothetical protein Q1695_002339 [Nippostrongylus brasiliensis]|nr:hypothetical protein Q1695_002339 [Nippostrongylus brasiliensis]